MKVIYNKDWMTGVGETFRNSAGSRTRQRQADWATPHFEAADAGRACAISALQAGLWNPAFPSHLCRVSAKAL